LFLIKRPRAPGRQGFQPTTRLIHQVVNSLYSSGKRQINFNQLMEACLEADTAADPIELRKCLTWAARTSYVSALQPKDPDYFGPADTEIKLKRELKKPVGVLFRGLERFRDQSIDTSL